MSVFGILWKCKNAIAVAALATALLGSLYAWGESKKREGVRTAQAHALQVRLDSAALHTARIDTVRVLTRQAFVQKVTQWKTDTVRLAFLAQPDSAAVPVAAYRALSATTDLIASTGIAALAWADSSTAAERREKLLWREKAALIVPTIVMPAPHKWRHRAEGAVIGIATYVTVQHFRK